LRAASTSRARSAEIVCAPTTLASGLSAAAAGTIHLGVEQIAHRQAAAFNPAAVDKHAAVAVDALDGHDHTITAGSIA
jgi:hypothetical protein